MADNNDSVYDKLSRVSSRDLEDSLKKGKKLDPIKAAAADANGDGNIDEQDVAAFKDAESTVTRKMANVSAKEIAEALEKGQKLTPEQLAAADVDGDGDVDEQDIVIMADAQMRLANKISGAIVGMESLSEEEKLAAERNNDGHINLTDSYRLQDDARQAKAAAARIKRAKTGKLPPV